MEVNVGLANVPSWRDVSLHGKGMKIVKIWGINIADFPIFLEITGHKIAKKSIKIILHLKITK